MADENPKLPTKEGLKRVRDSIQKRREKPPSDRLVQIIDEVTREKSTEVVEKDIAAKSTSKEQTI